MRSTTNACTSPSCRTSTDLKPTSSWLRPVQPYPPSIRQDAIWRRSISPSSEQIASTCAARLPEALFIVVSNPVELAVQVLTEVVDRRRVIGMGAQQDSLRFARAIATDRDISRRQVRASVFGEHGLRMVPLWQSVELLAGSQRHEALLARLTARAMEIPLTKRVADLTAGVGQHLAAGRIADA
jgi:malate dehydrogenase